MSNSYTLEDLDQYSEDYSDRNDQREKHEKRLRKKDMRRLIEERQEQKRWQSDLESYDY